MALLLGLLGLLCEQFLALLLFRATGRLYLDTPLLFGTRLHFALLLSLPLLIGVLPGVTQLFRLSLGAAILFRALLSELLRSRLRERAVGGGGQQHRQ